MYMCFIYDIIIPTYENSAKFITSNFYDINTSNAYFMSSFSDFLCKTEKLSAIIKVLNSFKTMDTVKFYIAIKNARNL